MKLLYCPECGDMFNLAERMKACGCGSAWGQYVSDNDVIYSGGDPFSIHNFELVLAKRLHKEDGAKKYFSSWIPAADNEHWQKL